MMLWESSATRNSDQLDTSPQLSCAEVYYGCSMGHISLNYGSYLHYGLNAHIAVVGYGYGP